MNVGGSMDGERPRVPKALQEERPKLVHLGLDAHHGLGVRRAGGGEEGQAAIDERAGGGIAAHLQAQVDEVEQRLIERGRHPGPLEHRHAIRKGVGQRRMEEGIFGRPCPLREASMSGSLSGFAGLRALARALGGETFAGGRRALLPAPGHSAADRSVSLWLCDGRVVVHSFGACDWREVLDDLRASGWIDTDNRLCAGGAGAPAGPERAELTRAQRVRAARRLWTAAGAIVDGSPAWRHGRQRAVDLTLDRAGALRSHAAAPLAVYRDRGPHLPALLAALSGPDGAITAVEVTYLTARGDRSARARPPRKIVGVIPAGSAVRFTPVCAEMLVAEGVFTTLAAMARFRLPGWALLSTSNLRRWTPPPGVRRLLIAADRGPDGERSALRLRDTATAAGVSAEVALPPVGAGDWRDVWEAEGRKEGRTGAPGAEGRSLPPGRELPDAEDPRT